ncbi:MAG: hypothetical protein E7773_14955 [Sphingomonas sp.]|uniref:hypothetical protein n=1 Tax=Sphingomonas sp. TaxID=28214 RepID=UPI00122820D8|nr:hypothetical protein [Sphingomonas sp.]THD34486.1 MAG: hypothetical protein E7773_14955 [Sphingomonas sp.]
MLTALSLQSAQPAAAGGFDRPPPSRDCAGAEFRRLDFWLGRWDVFDVRKRRTAGESVIEAASQGCGIRERYRAPGDPKGEYIGESISAYDPAAGIWRQLYIDNRGETQFYTGRWQGDRLVFEAGKGQPRWRMTYRRNADSSVEQVGEHSEDAGATWTVTYVLRYRRHA